MRAHSSTLSDLINAAALQSLMEDFHAISGIPMAIIDIEGRVLVGAGWQDICTKFHRVNPQTCKACIESDTELSAGTPPGEFRRYRCKNNMWDMATPVVVRGRHVGNVFSGQFFYEDEPVDYAVFRQQAQRYGFDEAAYIGALDRVPRLSKAAVDRAMAFFVKLAHMVSQLGDTAVTLGQAIAERDAVAASLRDSESELKDKVEKLAEGSRLKDEFLSTLSHELRTPLNAIMGWAQLLQRHGSGYPHAPRAIDAIARNAASQARLVEDVLDVSRIITGKLHLRQQVVDLAVVIEQALDTVRPAADAKDICVSTSFEQPALVVGDPDRLQQVVWNLLSNAVKFSNKGGCIDVSLTRVNSHAEVRVADTGIGIAAHFLPHVFQRFSQYDSSTTRAYGGLGLGLAIVRHLVEMHGGTVAVDSPGEQRGTVFTVTLPVRAVVQSNESEAASRAQSSSALSDVSPSLQNVRILAVDDDASARELLQTVLGDLGADVTVASSAAEGMTRLLSMVPDVLISDIGMPGEDGYTFMRAVRRLPPDHGGRVPAVALTAYGQAAHRLEALTAGFDQYVTKPVIAQELAVIVASLARKAHTA